MKKNKIGLKIFSIFVYIISVSFIFSGVIGLMVTNNGTFKNKETDNLNIVKAVSSKDLMTSFQSISKKNLNSVVYDNFEDAVYNSKFYPTSFVGKLGYYKSDCPICNEDFACNNQLVGEKNIYYEDNEYGKVRIVATSSILPCGSIVKINISDYGYTDIYAIVLDRGVSGSVVDLLKEELEDEIFANGFDNVTFDIIRYGY